MRPLVSIIASAMLVLLPAPAALARPAAPAELAACSSPPATASLPLAQPVPPPTPPEPPAEELGSTYPPGINSPRAQRSYQLLLVAYAAVNQTMDDTWIAILPRLQRVADVVAEGLQRSELRRTECWDRIGRQLLSGQITTREQAAALTCVCELAWYGELDTWERLYNRDIDAILKELYDATYSAIQANFPPINQLIENSSLDSDEKDALLEASTALETAALRKSGSLGDIYKKDVIRELLRDYRLSQEVSRLEWGCTNP